MSSTAVSDPFHETTNHRLKANTIFKQEDLSLNFMEIETNNPSLNQKQNQKE